MPIIYALCSVDHVPQTLSRLSLLLFLCLFVFMNITYAKCPTGKKQQTEEDLPNQGLFPMLWELIKSCAGEAKPTNQFAPHTTALARATICSYRLR